MAIRKQETRENIVDKLLILAKVERTSRHMTCFIIIADAGEDTVFKQKSEAMTVNDAGTRDWHKRNR